MNEGATMSGWRARGGAIARKYEGGKSDYRRRPRARVGDRRGTVEGGEVGRARVGEGGRDVGGREGAREGDRAIEKSRDMGASGGDARAKDKCGSGESSAGARADGRGRKASRREKTQTDPRKCIYREKAGGRERGGVRAGRDS